MRRNTYHILKIDSFTGDDVTRNQHEILDEEGWNVQEIDALYAVIRVGGNGAEIVDDGYRSIDEIKQSWPEAKPLVRS